MQYNGGCVDVYLIGEEEYVAVLEDAVEYEAGLEAIRNAERMAATGVAAATAAAALENVAAVGFWRWSAEMSKFAEA